MLLCLDSEKQHKGANVKGYINCRLVQWRLCMAALWLCSCLAYPCAILPCRDTGMEREQWGLRRPPGGSPLPFARTHGITDVSEPQQRGSLLQLLPQHQFVFNACAFPHAIFIPRFEGKRPILCSKLPFGSIVVVPFVQQNHDLLKETGQLFAPVAAVLEHNKFQQENASLYSKISFLKEGKESSDMAILALQKIWTSCLIHQLSTNLAH